MPGTPKQIGIRKPGFIREALGELKRKFQRRKLRRQLRQQEGERNQAFVRLGKRAWEEKIELAAFPFLRDRLLATESKSQELADTSTRLQAEKSELEQRRQGEMTAFDNRRRPIEEKKRQVDVESKAAQQQFSIADRAVKQAEHRLAQLAVQLLELEKKAASAAATPSPQPTGGPTREQLLAEQAQVSEGLQASRPALQAHLEEVNRLAAESRQQAEEITTLESQRRAALAPLDTALGSVRGQLAAAAQQTTGLHTEREELFRQLGLTLYGANTQEPALSQEVQQIATLDQARGATNALLEASLSLSRAVPPRTMLKFWALVVLLPVLAVGMGYGAYSLIPASGETEGTSQKFKTFAAPALSEPEKDAAVTAFIDSRQNRVSASEEKTRAAVRVLGEDLLDLGSTGDAQYFPVLVRVFLRSDVPDLRAAAADAIGMIGPRAEQTAPLAAALNDPVPVVRQSAMQALAASADPSARDLLVRARRAGGGYSADSVPGEPELGVPVYPGARYLYFASSLMAGRAAFETSDATSSVLSFYADKAQHPPATPGEAPPASPPIPTAAVPAASLATTGIPGLADYNNEQLYGNPLVVVIRETDSGGVKLPTHFAVVFEDRVLKQTGIVLHFVPPPPPPLVPGEAGNEIVQ